MQLQIPRPEGHVFQGESKTITQHLLKQPQVVFQIEKIEYPDTGGMFIYHKGLLHPAKGFPTPEACQAVNIVKRMFIGQVRFLAKNLLTAFTFFRKKTLKYWIDQYLSVAQITLGPYYLKDIRYRETCRELMKIFRVFLDELGFTEQSYDLAKTIVTLFEYDDAYLFILQDLANETSLEQLIKNPRKEFKRLLEILKQRDKRPSMRERATSFTSLILYAFWIPKVRKAFRKAFLSADFSKIQMDKGDRYHVLRWNSYNFFGQPFEERIQEFVKLHKGVLPRAFFLQG